HDLRDEFAGSGRFLIKATPGDERQMQALLDRGQVDGVIRVLPGFARDIARGQASSVQVLLDGTNSNTASLVSGYASQVIARYSQEAAGEAQRSRLVSGTMSAGNAISVPMPQVVARSRVWYNPDLKSRNYF